MAEEQEVYSAFYFWGVFCFYLVNSKNRKQQKKRNMKQHLFLFLLMVISFPLFSQRVVTEKNATHPAMYKINGSQAQRNAKLRSGIALTVLGPTKIVVGTILGGFAIGDLAKSTENGNYLTAIICGVVGGFHFVSGIALTTSGAILLNKAKRQKAGSSKVFLSIPDVNVNYSMTNREGIRAGIHTSITF